jgi:DNA-binding transcriptional MerR regulator
MENTLTLNDLLSSSHLNVNDIIYLVDEEVLQTVGDSENQSESDWYFTPDSLSKIRHVDNLSSLGYPLNEAVKIIKNYGTPDGDKKNLTGKHRKRNVLFTPIELARLFNVSPRAVKYWEEKQLIRPFNRSKSGIRFYHKKTKIEIMLLKAFQSLGFSLDRIKVFLELYNFILDDEPSKMKDRNRIDYYFDNLDELDEKLGEFENSIESLRKLSGKGRRKLELMIKNEEGTVKTK